MLNQPLISTWQCHQSNYYFLFNRLDNFLHGTNPPSSPPRAQDKIEGATRIFEEVLADFPTPILPNISGEPTREVLIDQHKLISGKAASLTSNLQGGRHIKPRADDDGRGIHGTKGLRICATAQPRKLPTNNGNHPRASAQNQKFLTKLSTIQKIHLCGRIPRKSYRRGGVTSLPVPIGGPDNRICKDLRACYVTSTFYLLRGDRHNQPQVKRGKHYGSLQPRGTSNTTDQTTGKGRIIHTCRKVDN